MLAAEVQSSKESPIIWIQIGQFALAFVVLFLFLVSLELITSASSSLGSDFTEGIIKVTGVPLVSLFIGMLATAIIQSSSTLTSSIVALVAGNFLTLEAAVPMVLGANIGTSVTSIMVSLGHLGTPKAFRRGFMTASSHVVFNLISAIIFFPLEMQWNVLSISSQFLANHLSNWGAIGVGWFAFYQAMVSPFANLIQSVAAAQPIVILGFSLVLLFICIYTLSSIFKSLILDAKRGKWLSGAFNNSFLSLLSGAGITAAIHSSSVTTSLSVILASTKRITPKKLFPFILGANVGTTITALMAAIGRSEAALAIAICHMIFNVLGVAIFYPIEAIRNIPLAISKFLADLCYKNPVFAFAYLIILFFALPFFVIFLSEKF